MADTTVHDQTNLRAAYQEICTSYHAIEDLGAKLLGFLPLASGEGIFLLLTDPFSSLTKGTTSRLYLVPAGVLGALITLGLLLYNLREQQLRRELIASGAKIESLLGAGQYGQFSTRPDSIGHVVNSGVVVNLIYTSVFAGWVFLALIPTGSPAAFVGAGIAFIVFLLGVCAWLYYRERSVKLAPQPPVYVGLRLVEAKSKKIAEVAQHLKNAVEPLISLMPEVVAFYVVNESEGRGAALSICQTQAAEKELARQVEDWVNQQQGLEYKVLLNPVLIGEAILCQGERR